MFSEHLNQLISGLRLGQVVEKFWLKWTGDHVRSDIGFIFFINTNRISNNPKYILVPKHSVIILNNLTSKMIFILTAALL